MGDLGQSLHVSTCLLFRYIFFKKKDEANKLLKEHQVLFSDHHLPGSCVVKIRSCGLPVWFVEVTFIYLTLEN